MKKWEEEIIRAIVGLEPKTQAIYLFGTFGTEDERVSSDVDIAVLFPIEKAKAMGALNFTDIHFKLADILRREVDIINLRLVSTVLQKEVIAVDRKIYVGNLYAAEEFEMLTLSYYQRLNDERKEILDEFFRSKRAYSV